MFQAFVPLKLVTQLSPRKCHMLVAVCALVYVNIKMQTYALLKHRQQCSEFSSHDVHKSPKGGNKLKASVLILSQICFVICFGAFTTPDKMPLCFRLARLHNSFAI